MTLALELYRSVPRYLSARTVGARLPGLVGGMAPLRLVDKKHSAPPSEQWVHVRPRLSGICGSDLNTIAGRSSFYFSALVSLPFVPGHEIVAETTGDVDGLPAGTRVVVDPVLSCHVRGIDPPCTACANEQPHLCERITGGHISPGLQTGYCADTGGGWSEGLLAHRKQLHAVPEEVSDDNALLTEPLSCAIHAAQRAAIPRDATVLVVGAGAVGLLTLIALRRFTEAGKVIVVAKHRHQADFARAFGASEVIDPKSAPNILRSRTHAFRLDPERSTPFLLGGVDVSFDCAGSSSSLDLALRTTRARGRVVLAAMPPQADLSPAWFRELEIVGAYSGPHLFAPALELSAELHLGRLVAPPYPLSQWRAALENALSAGRAGAVKVAFAPNHN